MKKNSDNKTTSRRKIIKSFLPVGILFLLLTFSIVTIAWFYTSRNIGALTEISNPTAIFINAGNAEDVRYLDLGGIDVEGENDYKDFVFCVRGNHVYNYKIQLSYTTNNQFDYEIYEADMTTVAGNVPANTESLVVYDTHDGSGDRQYYYAVQNATALAGSFLNKDNGAAEKLALDDDTYYEQTYTPTDAGSTYDNRDIYAIPLYWQTTGTISPVMDANSDFCEYYILRVRWSGSSRNNKETDIVYIAAKNISS